MSSAYAPTLDTSMEDYKALRDTFVDDTKDLELERILAIYAEDRQFREALKQHSMEAYGEVTADAPESIDLANAIFSKDNIVFAGKTAKAVGKGLIALAKGIKNFAVGIHRYAVDKTLTEEQIIKRFDRLINTYENIQLQHAQVAEVPTYPVALNRFIGLINVCNFIKQMAASEQGHRGITEAIYDKVADLSNGVLRVLPPEKNSHIKNLGWVEPKLETFDIMKSKWVNKEEVVKFRNGIVDVKFRVSEELAKASMSLVRSCDEIQNERISSQEEQDDAVEAYSGAYIISKLVKQIHKFGIQREISVFCTTYISRLCKYKSI